MKIIFEVVDAMPVNEYTPDIEITWGMNRLDVTVEYYPDSDEIKSHLRKTEVHIDNKVSGEYVCGCVVLLEKHYHYEMKLVHASHKESP